ncbi:DUF1837 domain-containing protein [Selenomonas noxia]|jgi:hypothetical protein|uniref:HamA C-terminal domain-containing protein n=1 Tax=Selenomonas noxia TaxID=135083 RepID=UPI0032C1BDA2
MEHLCIGSYVRVMTSCAILAERKFDSFCEKLFLSLCDDGAIVFSYKAADGSEVTYSSTNFSKIHSSAQNLPAEIMQMALRKDARHIERYFIAEIIPALDEARKKNAVLALKNIIVRDKNIADTTQLGTIMNLTKKELKNKNEFILSEFLTDIFIYAVAKTDNTLDPDFTKSIQKLFYATYTPYVDTISFYEATMPKIVASIPLTSIGKFNQIFTPISSETLSISANHDLQIFCLKFDDFDFDYHSLWRYLRNNIGYYVYSRAQINRYVEEEEISSLSYDAIAHIKEFITKNKRNSETELGELLLYIFLEQVLHAPKLMSNVELSAHNGIISSESSGIHLLTASAVIPFNQIVLGVSMLNCSMDETIDRAFADAQRLKTRKKDERRFVEATIFEGAFPRDVCEQLEAIILPSETAVEKPATAFGLFLGYTLDNLPARGKSIDVYQRDAIAQIKNDILNSVPYIESKVTQYDLDGYSLYIYLLPFTDVDRDKKDIMNKLLQIEGGSL